MEPVVLYAKKGRLFGLLLISLAFSAMGWFFLAYPAEFAEHAGPVAIRSLGAATLLFGLTGVLGIARELRNPKPRLVLDNTGIFDRTLGTPKIPWSSILSAGIFSIRGTSFIALELVDEQQRLEALPRWKRALSAGNSMVGASRFNLNLAALGVRPEEVLAMVQSRMEAEAARPDTTFGFRPERWK